MSRSEKDRPGGHAVTEIEVAPGSVVWSAEARRKAKREHRRAQRRESRQIERLAQCEVCDEGSADPTIDCEGFGWMMTDEEVHRQAWNDYDDYFHEENYGLENLDRSDHAFGNEAEDTPDFPDWDPILTWD